MKRILTLLLIVALLPALLPVPVLADETDNTLVELLDFTMPNGGDTPWVGVALSNPLVTFTVPYYTAINYVDIVIQIGNNVVPSSVYLKYVGRPNQEEVQLHIDKISDTMYRIYGTGATYTQDIFGLRFDFGSSTATASSITFKSVKFSPIPIEIYEMPVVGTLYNYGNNGQADLSTPFSYKADKVESTVTFTAFSEFDNSFLADMTPYNWQKYDYLDIHCAAWCQSVISVSAFLTDGTVVPLEVSTLVGEQTGNTALHIISIRADLTGLNRDFDGLMQINVTGSMFRGETCSFVLYGCRGGLKTESVNPVIYWLIQIPNSIAQWGQNIVDALGGSNDGSGVQDNINAAVGELDEVQGVLDGVSRPELDAIDFDVSGLVDVSVAATYGNIFSTLIGNQYMTNILMIAFVLAAASFLLFGRR